MMRSAQYCPQCGARLRLMERFGKIRPVCSRCDHTVFFDPKVAAVAFVEEGERVLLVKRANEPGKGRWALPAGFVDPEEDPRSAAERETLEETGIVVQAFDLLAVLHRPDADGLADIVIVYRARVIGGALCANDDADEVGWFSQDNLPEIALASTQLLIDRWRNGDSPHQLGR